MKFSRKINPEYKTFTNFLSKKRIREDEINFEKLRSYRLDRVKKELIKNNFKIPVIAYQVSGEYSLLSNSIHKGLVDKGIILESLIAFKRAGANAIVSYYADRLDVILK